MDKTCIMFTFLPPPPDTASALPGVKAASAARAAAARSDRPCGCAESWDCASVGKANLCFLALQEFRLDPKIAICVQSDGVSACQEHCKP
jgi:hypothetical protein